jgi:hypothetical protein
MSHKRLGDLVINGCILADTRLLLESVTRLCGHIMAGQLRFRLPVGSEPRLFSFQRAVLQAGGPWGHSCRRYSADDPEYNDRRMLSIVNLC